MSHDDLIALKARTLHRYMFEAGGKQTRDDVAEVCVAIDDALPSEKRVHIRKTELDRDRLPKIVRHGWPRMPRTLRFGALITAISVTAAAQQAVPSENELHSAYCTAVLEQQIAVYQRGLAQLDAVAKEHPHPPAPGLGILSGETTLSLTKVQTAWNRLHAYLLPRIATLDPSALLAAKRRGEADWQRSNHMPAQQCGSSCSPLVPPPEKQQAPICFDSCPDLALVKRVRACANPTWVPL
jgi:hypothetical protein